MPSQKSGVKTFFSRTARAVEINQNKSISPEDASLAESALQNDKFV